MHRKRTLHLFADFLIAVSLVIFIAWGLQSLPEDTQGTSLLLIFSAVLGFSLMNILMSREAPGKRVFGGVFHYTTHPKTYWFSVGLNGTLLVICLTMAVLSM